jgi:nicotinamidase-related amidase
MKPAILVIDMINASFDNKRLREHKSILVHHINELAEVGRRHEIIVFWIKEEFKRDLSDAPTSKRRGLSSAAIKGSEQAEFVDGINVKPGETVIIKKRYSPFFGTSLDSLLKENGIDTLIISGVNTHACVRMAAVDAYQRDYKVILAIDCIDSYDKDHHEISISYLSRNISKLMTNSEIVKYVTA